MSSYSPLLFLLPLISLASATTFTIINRCPYTIWPAAVPGGGRELTSGQTWKLSATANNGLIWGRTSCSFEDDGNGSCLTGDCGGYLDCSVGGSPPATLVEYSLNQYGANDFYGISLVDGFNVPVEIRPKTGDCSAVSCTANITGRCPAELKVSGGCKSACNVFKTNEFCCDYDSCGATKYSNFFKNLCPQAYSYLLDDVTSTFLCKSGRDYTIIFCP